MSKATTNITCGRCHKIWAAQGGSQSTNYQNFVHVKFTVLISDKSEYCFYDKVLCPKCSIELKDWIDKYE